MRVIQYKKHDRLFVAVVENELEVRPLNIEGGVYALALQALEQKQSLAGLIEQFASDHSEDYEQLVQSKSLLAPLTHPEVSRCYVTGTGLTHLGSAETRNSMHTALKDEGQLTDSIKMFRLGLEGGKPPAGEVGAQPEWFYKGNGSIVCAPEADIVMPSFAEDGGEEPELVGLYINDQQGLPHRIGFAIGNEFSDHLIERENYLWLSHSKLRACSFGPELLVGDLPDRLEGRSTIVRDGEVFWEKSFLSGEEHMCHSIANLEYHHFKYPLFRRAGDLHAHFLGTSTLSFGDQVSCQPGDRYEISIPQFGRALRNTLRQSACETFTIHQL